MEPRLLFPLTLYSTSHVGCAVQFSSLCDKHGRPPTITILCRLCSWGWLCEARRPQNDTGLDRQYIVTLLQSSDGTVTIVNIYVRCGSIRTLKRIQVV